MTVLLLVIALILAVFSGFLCWQVMEQRKLIEQMTETDQLTGLEKGPELVLTLRVLDPIALAKRESRSARLMADKLPVMVRKMVYQELMKELEAEMAEREIEVEMHLEYR